jgi:hypothetical protein
MTSRPEIAKAAPWQGVSQQVCCGPNSIGARRSKSLSNRMGDLADGGKDAGIAVALRGAAESAGLVPA